MLRIILSMVKSLEKIAKQKKIKYFLVTFVDLFGVQRAKLVPTRAIGDMQKPGAGFGGFATHLDLSFSESKNLKYDPTAFKEAFTEVVEA